MTLLTTTCPRCDEVVQVPVSSLLVALVSGADDTGRLAYICPECGDLTDQSISLLTVVRLCAAGCTPIEVVVEEKR